MSGGPWGATFRFPSVPSRSGSRQVRF